MQIVPPNKRSAWSTGESYNVDEFYTRATDDRGHSTYTRLIRMPPAILEQVESLISSREIPAYRNPADFYRDAVVHRLAHLRNHTRSPKVRAKMEELLRRIHLEQVSSQYREELQWATEMAATIEQTCDMALQAGDDQTLRIYLARLHEDVDPAREPFRSRLIGIIEGYEKRLADAD